MLRLAFAALSLICALSLHARADEAPDLVLLGGRILTVDDQFSIVEALAIRGERIVATGSNDSVRALAGPETRIVELEGRTVIPGLIDNHNHVIRATEYWTSEVRLDGVVDRARAVEMLKAKAGSLPPGAWLLSLGGWAEEPLAAQGGEFTLDELDAIAPDRPAFLQVAYDHAHVNSAWLEGMGIPLVGGNGGDGLARFVVRDAAGRATGRIEGGFPMIGQATARFPAVSEQSQRAGIAALSETLAGMGVTTVYDPGGLGIREESYERMRAMAADGTLGIRVFHSLWAGTVPDRTAADRLIDRLEKERPFGGDDRFDRLAVGELLHQPFHFDNPLTPTLPDAEARAVMRDVLAAAARNGWPIEIHAIQGETIARILDLVEEVAQSESVRPLRWSIAHADNIGPGEIARARALGMTLRLRSVAVIGGVAPVFEKFGERAFHMPPLRRVQASGIRYGLGTDGTKAGQIDPFVTLWWAVTGRRLGGETILKETLSREEALIAHTRANAGLLFREADLGALAPGFYADLLVLDHDYLTVPADDIRKIRPLATMVGGKLVHGAF